MYFRRLSTSSFIKLDFVVNDVADDIDFSTLYGLIKITSFSTLFSLTLSCVLHLCIGLVSSKCCLPHIDFLISYIHLIHQLEFFLKLKYLVLHIALD